MRLARENIQETLHQAWQWLIKPTATDWDEARQEYMTRIILVLLSLVSLGATLFTTGAWLLGSKETLPLVGALVSAVFIAGWVLTARVDRRIGSYLPPALVFLVAVYDTYLEGLASPAILFYAVAILLAAMLLGDLAQWGMLLLSLVAYLSVGIARHQGMLLPAQNLEASVYNWVVSTVLSLSVMALLLWLSTRQYQMAIHRAEIYASELETLHDEMRHLAQATAHLNWVGDKLAASLNMSQISEQISHVANRIIDSESVSVWLRDADDGTLVCQASSDARDADTLVGTVLQPDQGIAGWVVQHGRPVVTADPAQDSRFFSGVDTQIGYRTRSLLAVPLRVRQQTIGVLEMVNKRGGGFTPLDVNLVEALAASVAIAIDNAQLVSQMRQYAAVLEAQNAELDAFSHTVAHDLKNPISAIMGYSGLLKMGLGQLPEETLQHHVQRISGNVQRMNNIIDELLLLASVRKMDEIAIGPVVMAEVVRHAQTRLEDMIATHEAEVRVAETWPVARGYAPWIEEVWVNYLSNAIKYGGRPPCVELGADEVLVAGRAMVRFWVRDNGAGLSLKHQMRLFAPFERLRQTRAEGHGLGLSIVRRIVEKLDGAVGVDSEVGAGSLFYFTLPCTDDAEAGEGTPSS